MLSLLTENLSLETATENFLKLESFINSHPIFGGTFKFMEIEVTNPSASYLVFHRLGFVPRDVIITNISTGTATPNYNTFNKDSIELNVSNPSIIRLLIGTAKR
jgi:hypothetical protein